MTGGRRPRYPSAEEKALWERVIEKATPLADRPKPPVFDHSDAPAKAPAPDPIPPFQIGETSRNQPLPAPARPEDPGVSMDRKAFQKMSRGRLRPEARLDLHGLKLDQAHPRLAGFIHEAYASGRRLVLVITGKGKAGRDEGPIPERQGVLRHQVPLWLSQPPLAPLILQVSEAHQRHGGGGAYYVYLRRRR